MQHERPQRAGFDFTRQVRCLCADMVARLPELAHIDLAAVAIAFAQARRRGTYGLQAALTPMRFEGGTLSTVRDGDRYTFQRLYDPSGREILYILSFYLPRFLDGPFVEKLATITHELWHINPQFNGDLRRHPGRCYAHGPSHEQFDGNAQRLADAWLAANPPESLYAFLQLNFRQLAKAHGAVYGTRIPVPKLIPTPATGVR